MEPARYNPEIYQRNILEPIEIEGERFDSIGMLNLLHCVPGNMRTKASIFDNLKSIMNPDAVLFGSSIMGRGVQLNLLARYLNWFNNLQGYLNNKEDNPEDLKKGLAQHFSDSSVDIVGSIALFWARN